MRELTIKLMVDDDIKFPFNRDIVVGDTYVRVELPLKQTGENIIMLSKNEITK